MNSIRYCSTWAFAERSHPNRSLHAGLRSLPEASSGARTPTASSIPAEVRLANRNSGILLETLRHDVTPAGMHYLLNHFDVPYVPDGDLAGRDRRARAGSR